MRSCRSTGGALWAPCLLAALAACAEQPAPGAGALHPGAAPAHGGGDPPASSGAGTGGSTSGQAPRGSGQVPVGGAPPDAGLPQLSCEDRPPAAFAAECSGCHGTSAAADARYPSLLDFAGSEAELIARVRSGGDGMPAFSAARVDDAALREIYAFLRARSGSARPALSLGSAQPLFAEPQPIVPATFVREDGVLITRGAGRVRGRHELEATYSTFGAFYFEDRTYGFVIEDFTPRGESRVRVSYLPVARPQDNTNFRAFKIYGDGNVFHSNTGMDSDVPVPSLRHAGADPASSYAQAIAPYARVQSHELTRNARDNRPLQQDDLFEFEFGIFIEPSEVSANSRTSYYTDTFRYRVGRGGLTADNADGSGTPGPSGSALLGGTLSLAWIYAEPETYFSQLALNVQHEHVQRFVEGRRLFHTDFGSGAHSEAGNPAFTEHAGKAGPLLVTTSCVRCHAGNGGGRTLASALDQSSSQVFKLYGADAALGNQLQLSEGSARLLEREEKPVTLADGSVVMLTRPRFELRPKSGPAPAFSARIARRLVGLGLLEAVDERSLLAQADPDDCDGDGISGRPHFVADPTGQGTRLGRFGWRAEKISVEHQVADALAADLGVQTRVFPGPADEVELDDADLERLGAYMRLLGVPAQRASEDPAVQQGEALFRSVGCAHCHLPALTTGTAHPYVELRGQQIRPFTDLLLHDLGPDLADEGGTTGDGADAQPATGSEWRTAPLWGVGLSREVQGYVALLHDGRAQSVLEAILWHGGEASAVRQRVVELSAAQREALIRFVESL